MSDAHGRDDFRPPAPFQAERPPEEQIAIYQREIGMQMRELPQLLQRLDDAARSSADRDPAQAARMLRDALEWHREALARLLSSLNQALDLPDGDAVLLRTQLAQMEAERNEALHKLFVLEQEHTALTLHHDAQRQALEQSRAELSEAWRQGFALEQERDKLRQQIDQLRPLVTSLEQRHAQLEAQVADLEQRATTQPGEFGKALGKAVDVIQQELTSLKNPYVDYGLQELDLQTQVNIQLDNGELNIRFPGLNEAVAPQNLSQLHLRLRPIPKIQQTAPEST